MSSSKLLSRNKAYYITDSALSIATLCGQKSSSPKNAPCKGG